MMKNKNKTGTLKEIKSKISFFQYTGTLIRIEKIETFK